MKLLVEIPEGAYELLQTDGVDWLGAEHILNAVANGKPLDEVLDEIKEEIKDNTYFINETTGKEVTDLETIEKIIEKRKEWPHKPCTNYEDCCEESGCPCVYYKAEGGTDKE